MRFDTEYDTPCPFRLARFGYRRIGEFRPPKPGEHYIVPTDGPDLKENEPEVIKAGKGLAEPRHIVEPVPEGYEPSIGDILADMFAGLAGLAPEEESD